LKISHRDPRYLIHPSAGRREDKHQRAEIGIVSRRELDDSPDVGIVEDLLRPHPVGLFWRAQPILQVVSPRVV
jgi:hypothetical protein